MSLEVSHYGQHFLQIVTRVASGFLLDNSDTFTIQTRSKVTLKNNRNFKIVAGIPEFQNFCELLLPQGFLLDHTKGYTIQIRCKKPACCMANILKFQLEFQNIFELLLLKGFLFDHSEIFIKRTRPIGRPAT